MNSSGTLEWLVAFFDLCGLERVCSKLKFTSESKSVEEEESKNPNLATHTTSSCHYDS